LPYLRPSIVKRVTPHQTDIEWNDGHNSSYPSWYLREQCPCAQCVEEFSGIRRIPEGSIPSTLERTDVQPVGNYALSFKWSDGHETGIYTFDFLRRICPCPECLPGGLKEPPENVPKPGSFQA
jgi:DUF971 family protein